MKTILKNSALVFILAGLLTSPFLGFGFMGVEQNKEEVLGINTSKINTKTVSREVEVNNNDLTKIVDQIDITLNLSKEKVQKFYDVIPQNYIGEKYDYIIVYAKNLKEQGIEIITAHNELSIDLGITTKNTKVKVIPVTILVIEK